MQMRFIVVLLALSLGAARVGHAQNFQAAAKHFTEAQTAFKTGHFHTAADGFKAAYDITRDPVLLFNIGESYEKAHLWSKAVQYYRQYVAESPRAADRAAVERKIL